MSGPIAPGGARRRYMRRGFPPDTRLLRRRRCNLAADWEPLHGISEIGLTKDLRADKPSLANHNAQAHGRVDWVDEDAFALVDMGTGVRWRA
jgi:hypothetical protein